MSESATIDSQQPSVSPKTPPPWAQVEADYLRGATTRELAAKYGIPYGTISVRCQRNNWMTKRVMAEEIHDQIVNYPERIQADIQNSSTGIQGSIQPFKEHIHGASIASTAIDLVTESLKWKERTYKTALKLANGVDRLDAQGMGDDGQTKKLAEAASALASIDATARRQLGLDAQDSEDFGLTHRATGRPGERHVMRRAQVIDVAPVESSTPEAFDPGI